MDPNPRHPNHVTNQGGGVQHRDQHWVSGKCRCERKGLLPWKLHANKCMIDISKPLCRGRKVRLGGLSQFWVDFMYERMPIFCYLCGMVTHDENDCLVGLRRTERMNVEDKSYGPWLRATQERL